MKREEEDEYYDLERVLGYMKEEMIGKKIDILNKGMTEIEGQNRVSDYRYDFTNENNFEKDMQTETFEDDFSEEEKDYFVKNYE